MDPLHTLDAAAGSMSSTQLGGRDVHFYNQWKESKDPRHMSQLLQSLKPLMLKEVNRQAGTLPTTALMAEAKRQAIHAIKTWDPNAGASISTHVTNYLQKVRRLNYDYQNSARLPESLTIQYGKFKEAANAFNERMGREPSDEELAKELGWSKKQVINLKSRDYTDLVEGGNENPSLAHKTNEDSLFIEHLKIALDPQEQEILFNPKNLSVTDLAASMGMSMSRYQYVKTKLVQKIEDMKHEFFK